FTLIEMLVAMTLTLFIMVIITTAFTQGLETFRGLKGIGDMQRTLRTAADRLRDDLRRAHFEGNRHLGDPAFPNQGPVQRGFFRIVQPTAVNAPGSSYFSEGSDLDGLSSWRATDHVLHFSINLRGDRPEQFLSVTVPTGAPYGPDPKPFDPASPNYATTNYFGQPPDTMYQTPGIYSTQWAEVAYYLVKTGSTDNPEDP